MREPYQIVEIDQQYCAHRYAQSPCNASSGDPCFNTLKTCADQPSYRESVLTLRFTQAKDQVPNGVIPSLLTVSSTPTQINSGSSKNKKALGVRSSVTVTLQDHPHSDYFVDPYRTQRNYIASDRGTFWTKWLARNPYYRNTALRIIEGDLASEQSNTRTYIIDHIALDSRGKVTIKAKDILTLADDEKALAPAPSRGELRVAINTTVSTLRVTGAVAADYPNTGFVRIGSEIIRYSGVVAINASEIQLRNCQRQQRGSEISSHSAGDRVQRCLDYIDQPIDVVIDDLLVTYGKINRQFIPRNAWRVENQTWLSPFNVSALITEPTGVTRLLHEICEQTASYVWYDERQEQIRFKAVRPVTEQPARLNEHDHLMDGVKIKHEEKERYSQVWVFHGQRDPTKTLNDDANWLRLRIAADDDNPYNENQIKKVYSRWIQTEAQASAIANRLLSRYKRTPIYLDISLDAKDGQIWTGDICDITTSEIVDFTGAAKETRFQVLSAEEVEAGHKILYKLINFVYFGKFAYWMGRTAPSYGNATELQRQRGLFWAGENGKIGNDDGYSWQ